MKYFIILFYLLSTLPAGAALTDVDKTQIFSKNIMPNGGFELGKSGWTPNDTADFAVTTTTPMVGLVHATWDADASADTLAYAAFPIQAGYYGRNGVASCLFTTASGTATVEIQATDGSNVLSEASITSSTTPTRTSTNFIFPSSGSIQLRLYANADEPSIAIDDCYLGPAEGYNVSSVSQATFVGQSYFAATASCLWSRTNTALGAFTADTDCPGPTVVSSYVGSWQTTDSNLPKQTINNLPPGIYEVTVIGSFYQTVAAVNTLSISDGTTTCPGVSAENSSAASSGQTYTCSFNYSSAGDRSFEVYGSSGSSTININNTSQGQTLTFILKRFPTSSEQAYTPDLQAMSWSGYHDSTCGWTRASTAFADPSADTTCSLVERVNNNFGTVSSYLSGSDDLPGITFTPKKVGTYKVCAIGSGKNSNIGTLLLKLWDGTTTVAEAGMDTINTASYSSNFTACGLYKATSTASVSLRIQMACSVNTCTIEQSSPGSSAIEWTIFSLDQSIPAPVLTNMVTSGSSGGVKMVSASLNCDAGSAVTSSEAGFTSLAIGNIASGSCTITWASTIWSAAPRCFITATTISGGGDSYILGFTAAPTTTGVTIHGTYDDSTNVTTADFDLLCIGAR